MESKSCGCHRQRTAFTLVEMLLVVAILIVLAAVLYSAFGPVRARAREATCVSNLRQIGQAIAMYRADADGGEVSEGAASSCVDLGLPCFGLSSTLLSPYKIDKRMVMCSDYKGLYGKEEGLGSTYVWPMSADDSGIPEPFRFRTKILKRGDSSVIVYDPNHNRLFNLTKEPNWMRQRVLVLRLNGQVDSLSVPLRSANNDW
ncbi:MAG: type II secretion system protein [Fibrella sp.]|nr:type II secretion system protein [Armatimonadota bacterium]